MKPRFTRTAVTALALAGIATAAQAAGGDTLKTVQDRGSLICTGHNGSYPGMAEIDDQGNWRGFDINLCKALATAIFGTDEGHLKIAPTSWAQRFPGIQSGDLDIIIKSTGWTMGRDTDVNLQYSRVYMMAPIALITHADNGAEIAADLDGGSVCLPAGTTIERNVADHALANGYEVEIVAFEKVEEAKASYLSGRCDAYSDWDLQLAVLRATEADDPNAHVILPDVLSAEPLAFAMRQGDDEWVDLANWFLSAVIMAEENGITSENVDEIRADPPTPGIAKLLGATPGVGERLGLSDDWAYNVIKQHGNYGEMWERNVGASSPYGLARGVNGLLRNGGIIYSLVMD